MYVSGLKLIQFITSHSCSAWGISSLVHAGILFLIGCCYWQNLFEEEQRLILTISPAVRVEEFTPIITVPDQRACGGAKSEVSVNRMVREQSSDIEVREISIEKPLSLLSAMSPIFESKDLTARVRANIKDLSGLRYLAGLDQGGDAKGDGEGSGSFLQVAPTYRKIVYVVDASGSMNHPHESPALTRIGRVKIELLRSVDSLQSHQEFCVIFFTEFALTMPGKSGFIMRGGAELEAYLTWVAKHFANGNTDPRLALQKAFDMEPEVIYFLTDGEVNPLVARDIIRLNPKRVKINTICIGSAPSEHLMRQIALKHQGIYTFVP